MQALTTKTRGRPGDSWYNTKGKTRVLTIEIENMRRMFKEREENIRQSALIEGATKARAMTFKGYDTEIRGDQWVVTKRTELEIDKTIYNSAIVKLEEWIQMKVPIRLVFHTQNTRNGQEIYNVTVENEAGGEIRLFHTNNMRTCWGEETERRRPLTQEGLEEMERIFKELMTTVNHYSTYSVSDTLVSTNNYIKLKYRTDRDRRMEIERIGEEEYKRIKEEDKRKLEKLKSDILKQNIYLKKEEVQEDA